MEEPTNDAAPQEEATEETLGRRQLLKALAATGGAAAAASLLPGKWAKPVIEAGVLPAHAQVSPGPRPTEQPTEEPQPARVIACYAFNAAGGVAIYPDSIIATYAEIQPNEPIQVRRTITVQGQPSPFVYEGVASVTAGQYARFDTPDFDLSALSPPVQPGVDVITILYEIIDPAYQGVDTCVRFVTITEPQ
jgi:hypothetical protein